MCILFIRPISKTFICFFILFFPQMIFAKDLAIGDKAPNLLGNDAISGHRINLYMKMAELQFERDKYGNLVTGADGKYISKFTRNVLVLNFFSRTCIPCIREIPAFNNVFKKYQDKSVKFLYVNVDPDITQSQAQHFIENLKIEVPMMLCNQAEAIRKYHATVLPRLFVINKSKKISNIITGFDENLEEELNQIIDGLLEE